MINVGCETRGKQQDTMRFCHPGSWTIKLYTDDLCGGDKLHSEQYEYMHKKQKQIHHSLYTHV